ncbi:beta-ketoacyl-ACP synthase III [Streptomyces phaeofaciens JCM 4814]|uniref:3-oxoacyl-[acyl-carrier-protein] synthase 3 n=1 Tax=Streptomyces phaeofaciens TaxID=68254 RepID=A0A918M1A1_9ACTN|nr:3-oxoacyl-[acyl-carrier-protein] synthase 3 [Streptomyces phaeofaciens]
MRSAVLSGLGACLPARTVKSSEIEKEFNVRQGWITSRTGIELRHFISPGEATGDLAVRAGERALAHSGVHRADALVLATSTPDQLCPPTAPQVAAALGLGHVAAFDVAAVCSGFVYALVTAAGLIATSVADRVLVIGADTFSTIVDPNDLATRAVFGDGAGAAVLRAGRADEPGALSGMRLSSDGTGHGLITIQGGGSRARSTSLPVGSQDMFLTMAGQATFTEAVRRMSESVMRTAADCSWTADDIDRIVLHQANARILAAVARRLELPSERFVSNIAQVGNTAAASIPLALATAAATGELTAGHRVVLGSFGGGLTWGSAALVWPQLNKEVPHP